MGCGAFGRSASHRGLCFWLDAPGRGQVAVGRLFFKGWGAAMHRCLAGRYSSERSAERSDLLTDILLMWRPDSRLEGQ